MKRTIRKTRHILIALTIALVVSGFSVLREHPSNAMPIYADTKTTEIKLGNESESGAAETQLDMNDKATDKESITDEHENVNSESENPEPVDEAVEKQLDPEIEEKLKSIDVNQSVQSLSDNNSELINRTMTEKSPQRPQNFAAKAISSNAMIVTSFAQLKSAIEAGGMVNGQKKTIFYLGSDIVGTKGGITIPNGYSFSLDGKNPNTQVIHTFYEYGGTTESDTIRYTASGDQSTNFIRNVNIVGQNKSGFFTSKYANVTFELSFVDYTGPKVATLPKGAVVFRDSNVNVTTARLVSTEQVASAREVYLTETNTITTSPDMKEPVFASTELFIIAGEKVQNIYSANPILSSSKANVLITDKTVVNINGIAVSGEKTVGGIVTTGSFDNYGNINFNADKLTGNIISSSAFDNTGKLKIDVGTITSNVLSTTTFKNSGTITVLSEKSSSVVNSSQRMENKGIIDANINEITSDSFTTSIFENSGDVKLLSNKVSGNVLYSKTSLTNTGLIDIKSEITTGHVVNVTEFINDGVLQVNVQEVTGSSSDIINSTNLTNLKEIDLKTKKLGNSFINNSYTIINKGNIKVNGGAVGRDLIYSRHYFYNYGNVDLSADTVGSYGIRVEISNKDSFINEGGNIKIRANQISNYVLYSFYFINRDNANVDINVLEGGTASRGITIYRDNIFENSTAKFVIGNPEQESKPRTNVFYTDGYGKFEFIDSRITIDTADSGYTNVFNTPSVKFVSTGSVPAYLNIINYSGSTNFGSSGTKFNIDTQQINIWDSKPTFTTYPDATLGGAHRFVMNDYRNFNVSGSISAKGDPTFDKTSTPSTDTISINDNLTFNNQEVISMGNMMLDVPKNTESLSKLKLKTNPGSWVQLASKPTFDTYADENGNVDTQLPHGVSNDKYRVDSFGDNLYRNSDVQYHVDGDLSILEIPTQISFPEIELHSGPNYYDRDSQMKIAIEDNRLNKTGWKLSVRIIKPLQISGRPESRLDKALHVNKNAIGEELVTVYETTGLDYSSNTEVIWESNEGIQLYIENYNRIYANTPYEASLEWVLQAK